MPPPDDTETVKITIGSTRAFRSWANRLVRHCRSSISAEFDRALLGLAKASGFAEPPPDRVPPARPRSR